MSEPKGNEETPKRSSEENTSKESNEQTIPPTSIKKEQPTINRTTDFSLPNGTEFSMKKEGTLVFAKRALSIMLEYPIYFALMIISMSVIDSGILMGILKHYNVQGSLLQQNAQLIPIILSFMGANLIKILIAGPVISIAVVYLGYAFTQNKEMSPYNILNFVLRNYGKLFVPFLIAQLFIQLGMIVVIPGVLFMMQYAFLDSVVCLEKSTSPISRSRTLTRAVRKSLLGFIIPWAVFSQVSGLVILQFSDNFASLTSINIITQAFYTFILCAFFCAYEYRSYRRSAGAAIKEEKEIPHRPLTEKKTNSGLGWATFLVVGGACAFFISTSLHKQSYVSCVTSTVQKAFQSSPTSSSTFEAKSTCESAKKTCSAAPPCEISCNITKYNITHPKDPTQAYTMTGAPNITQCGQ